MSAAGLRSRAVAFAVAAGLIFGWVLSGSPATATATAAPVTIAQVSPKVVAAGAKATVKPRYSVRKGVRVIKTRVDVRRGSTWVARGVRSARVPAGTYRITTRVSYRQLTSGTWGSPRTTTRSQTVRVTTAATQAAAPVTPAAPAPVPSLVKTSAACDNTSLARPDGTPWLCTFSDEFSGFGLDRSKWVPQRTADSGYQIGADCYFDRPENVSVGGGSLSLTVRKEAEPFTCDGSYRTEEVQHSAGSVSTYGKFAQAGGRFEVRAAFPTTRVPGHHSAVWLFPQRPQLSGEIDIAEIYSQFPDQSIPYLHYLPYLDETTTNYGCGIDDISKFHTYTAEWTPTTISIAYDGVVCVKHTIRPIDAIYGSPPFDNEFIVVLTQGLGVNDNSVNAGTPVVGTMKVDYVRVWK